MTPQAYRDWQGDPFLIACNNSQQFFFKSNMPFRNEQDGIIFAGTMGLIRTSVLKELGGWDEWCITEDAELSLRALLRGYSSVYVQKEYDAGLLPLNFDGLRKQRFHWTFGGMQIIKKHWPSLMPWAGWVDPSKRGLLAHPQSARV